MTDSYRNTCRQQGQLLHENKSERIKLYGLISVNQSDLEQEKARIQADILHFFRWYAWTHDPRPGILSLYGLSCPTLPFLLFPFQEDFVLSLVDHIQRGEDILVEKTRDMGVSWLVVTVFLWFWLQPISGNDFLIGSRKFELVDRKGAQDTLLEKIRYNLKLLPPPLLPAGFSWDKYDNVGFILNPATGSFIKGEGNNANFGTGGRYKAAMMDEYAKWEETDEQAWTSMGDATPCRIPVSSPWGLGRKFAQLRFSGAVKVLTLHWTKHPLKSAGLYMDENNKPHSEWYDAEVRRRSDDPEANIGQELDINYLTSGHPYFDNTLIQERFEAACKQPWEGKRYEFELAGDKVKQAEHPHGRLWIRKGPDTSKEWVKYRYCISCDVAEGLEKGDFSSVYVHDRVKGEDVAWFHGRIDTDVLALLLNHLAIMYDNAWIGPESNNHGLAVINRLKMFKCSIMFQQDFTEWADKDSIKLGWATNVRTRPVMCADLREAVKKQVDGIHDPDFWREAMTFILNNNGKPEAAPGNYDDRVMAQAIKIQLHAWLPPPVKASYAVPDYGYTDHGKLAHIPLKRPKGSRFV